MDQLGKILNNKKYKKQLDQLNKEKLELISKNPLKALEVAKRGIEQLEPKKINDVEYLQFVANGIQKLARELLHKKIKEF